MHTSIRSFTRPSLGVGGFIRRNLFTLRSSGEGRGGGGFTTQSLRLVVGIVGLIFLSSSIFAQSALKWSFATKDVGNCQVDLIITGTIQDGFYTYSQFLESEDGPVATTLTFQEGAHFKLVGKAKESGGVIKAYDQVFDMTLSKFKHNAIFTQRVEVKDPSKPIAGYLNFMACNDDHCEPQIGRASCRERV